MKILFINVNDVQGGAATSFFRLFNYLLKEGHDVNMLVLNKKSNLKEVYKVTKLSRLLRKMSTKLITFFKDYKYGRTNLFSINITPSLDINKFINKIKPDIVHLKWINSEMLSINSIANIKVPIIWTLADMWAFTGGCHYSSGCEKFKFGCGACPILYSTNSNDLSSGLLKKKIRKFENITCVVGQSKWMENHIKNSKVFMGKNVVNIPNGIDKNIFLKRDKTYSQKIFEIDSKKKIVLFGAVNAKSDMRKGYDLLNSSLKHTKTDFDIIIFGTDEIQKYQDSKNRTIYEVGKLNSDQALSNLYSTCDVVVVPSREDNFPNVVLESLMCSIPVVAFDIGGIPDMVNHKQNGYLAKPFSITDLAVGIDWVLNNGEYNKISRNARSKAEKNFEIELIAEKYINLY